VTATDPVISIFFLSAAGLAALSIMVVLEWGLNCVQSWRGRDRRNG
jgi:hypothetical protein